MMEEESVAMDISHQTTHLTTGRLPQGDQHGHTHKGASHLRTRGSRIGRS
jgi:hypothetical protein